MYLYLLVYKLDRMYFTIFTIFLFTCISIFLFLLFFVFTPTRLLVGSEDFKKNVINVNI